MTHMMSRPVHEGWGVTRHPVILGTGLKRRPGARVSISGIGAVSGGWTQSGPRYMGMDPSNPLTYVRPWQPAAGMIAFLNFDGAAMQGRTPTGGLQRGPQSRPRRLKVSP